MKEKLLPQVITGITCAVLFFFLGAAAGWCILIAPADGPKDPFDLSNVEILLICGLIPAVIGSTIGVFVFRAVERGKEQDSYR
ncbi:MAG TPA: hypothetical protein EYN91_16080 [Candidatus Melainabacteria bacterium]|jgi:hypothetical protein|nr:hypothetical protein [Candidatus Melainabacteria bacterium]HIN63316.1 hypothetical protein [Candidatus Obscuribacterales bacterium]